MLYKFKSKAGSDVIMMGPNGDEVLRALGKAPAPKGIIEAADMPAAIQALEQAIQAEESARSQPGTDAPEAENPPTARTEQVGLKQRAWPLLELMKRAHPQGEEIVWGV